MVAQKIVSERGGDEIAGFRDPVECHERSKSRATAFAKRHVLKHMARNLIRKAPGNDSLRLKRKTAAWDDGFLASLPAA